MDYTILGESKIARNNKEIVLEATKSYEKAKRLGSFGIQKEIYQMILTFHMMMLSGQQTSIACIYGWIIYSLKRLWNMI